MTARRRIDPDVATPGADYLRAVVLNTKASHADRMKAALALAPLEKAVATRAHELGKRARERKAATEPSGDGWDALLTPPKRAQ
ncbi:hypothetical protein [Variovorax sp. Sphag1AA]|uniref:hypothetical protein n=1 Tax=Variovorax sp. Sphag1AA TaxID=2587027 RepID=UPI00161F9DC3|nr:hypothetical protein [Variovorax sp. Sphag1AA]MBB3180089.1 hypothetical protein [Variovorax sp. Sphag1AA]